MAWTMASIQGWCPWCGEHMAWGFWPMMVGWILVLVIGALLVWALVRAGQSRGGAPPDRRDPAEDTLREQYARGDIDEETYRSRLSELRRG